jgi:uncharacterized membrane protein YfcA
VATLSIPLWLPFAFFAIAVVYATAGLGGGSSYLAALALTGLPHLVIPQLALACNILVTAGGTWHFWREGRISFPDTLPYLAASVPAAYLGGRIPLDPRVFAIVLGCVLFAAGAQMLFTAPREALRPLEGRRLWIIGLPLGAVLGLFSGLVGIGGGIFLAAVLVFARWADARTAAGTAAVFTLINSIAAFTGHATRGILLGADVIPLLVAVVAGGQIGSLLGARHLPVHRVRRVLALLLLFVSARTLWHAARI